VNLAFSYLRKFQSQSFRSGSLLIPPSCQKIEAASSCLFSFKLLFLNDIVEPRFDEDSGPEFWHDPCFTYLNRSNSKILTGHSR
jgi:hypothetical protein